MLHITRQKPSYINPYLEAVKSLPLIKCVSFWVWMEALSGSMMCKAKTAISLWVSASGGGERSNNSLLKQMRQSKVVQNIYSSYSGRTCLLLSGTYPSR